ncbi:Hcp family type VI secretion system effector [Pseudomonas sp. NA-150]|uniref:Hcp family type VI secretion system effector n=1 Tax=Pseudomonas sp. NA-150 TaxID=3367525 RepID=UPI0037C73D16
MAASAYLTIKGSRQGSISAGALGPDSGPAWQQGHEDQIMVHAVDHHISAEGGKSNHRIHRPLVITKVLDKSTPLLLQALNDKEALDYCRLELYRTSTQGGQEHFLTIELEDAVITDIEFQMPRYLDPFSPQITSMETVHIAYRRIRWAHEIAKTFANDEWEGGGASDESIRHRLVRAHEQARRERKDYGHIIQVTNSETGKPAINRGCIVTKEGKSWESWTNECGQIEIETADIDSDISIHVNYEAPTGEYSDYRKKVND